MVFMIKTQFLILKQNILKKITYDTALQENLKVMDASAIALARDNCIPIIVFSLFETDDFLSIVEGMGRFHW